ncbi:MAG: cytochrome [Gammaproteobacteria bacterium]|nr:cytochrome [Gammaproteobacteria bacterium]
MNIPHDIAATLVNPRAYGDGRAIEAAHTWLRQHQPLGRAEIAGFDPFRVVTRHADILQVSRDNDSFHSGDRALMIMDRDSIEHAKAASGSPNLIHNISTMDAPEHHKYRTLTQQWFVPKGVAQRTERIRSIARVYVEKLLAGGPEIEFTTIATEYALRVIMDILGIPESDQALMLHLTKQMVGIDDVDLRRTGDTAGFAQSFFDVRDDFGRYFARITSSRREHAGDDVASVIANGTIDGHPLAEREATDYYVAIATAGHETTSNSITGGIWGLAENPGEFAKVQKDRALIGRLVDEAIRWTTPIQSFMRCATDNTQLGGEEIQKGEWLMLCYSSGNRDEQVFDAPFAFLADRQPNRHLAFGFGAHVCLGMHLAKLEMRIFFEELLPRLASLELAGVVRRVDGLVVGGVKSLPIRFSVN